MKQQKLSLDKLKDINLSYTASEDSLNELRAVCQQMTDAISKIKLPEGLSEEDKNLFIDNVHNEINEKWAVYQSAIYNFVYDFSLIEAERYFILDELVTKGTFDVDSLLIAEKLYSEWLYLLVEVDVKEWPRNYGISISQSVSLHHLLKLNVKIKGLMSPQFVMYSALLKRIGAISKQYQEFENIMKDQSVRLRDALEMLETVPGTESTLVENENVKVIEPVYN